jgi:hypothetical protein
VLSGVTLTLMIGPVVALPVPKPMLDALESVEVTSTVGSHSVFQLTFKLSTDSPLHTLFLVAGGSALPFVRVIVAVTLNGLPEVLIDGVVTQTSVTPAAAADEPARLVVTGDDLTRVMDFIPFSGTPFPGMPAEARVELLMLKYAVFGVVPLVIPSILIDVPIPVQRIPRQQGTDLAYVTSLADDVGYSFYLEPGPLPGASIAYWGPEVRIGVPQPALSVAMDAHTNVGSLSFNYDNSSRTMPILFIQEPTTKIPIPIPIPDVSPLSPPLGIIEPFPNRFEPIENAAKLTPLQAAAIALARAAKSADAVSGRGSLDVIRYGHVLRARRLVGVRGAGPAFDGLHFVKSVTHKIKRGEFKQDFQLVRNGLLPTVPRVLP